MVWIEGGTTDLEVRVADQRATSARDFDPVAKAVDATARRCCARPTRSAPGTCWSGSRRCRSPTARYRGAIAEVAVRG